MVRLTDDGSVLYRAEQDHCRRFPRAASADLRGGPRRNFQVFSAFDFLAEVTQHIPDKGEHLVRYYGWYSHRQRGLLRIKKHTALAQIHHAPSVQTCLEYSSTYGSDQDRPPSCEIRYSDHPAVPWPPCQMRRGSDHAG